MKPIVAIGRGAPGQSTRSTGAILPIAVVIALAGVLAIRIVRNWDLPLGFDETFTAIITGQPDWASFVREARRDLAAPLYYLMMWPIPGDSNVALRLPSLLLMIGAAVLAWTWHIAGHASGARFLWAGLLLLWLPGEQFAFDARPYALLFFLSTAQTIAFARLLDAPGLRRSFVWTGFAALSLLTHYMAGALGLAQGLILLIVVGRRALRLWPSLLLLAVPFVDLIDHLPLLRKFQATGANWLPQISSSNLETYLFYGIGSFGLPLIVIAVVSRIADRREPMARNALLAGAAAILATILLVGAGWGRQFVVDRYLIASAPGMLLALATIASGLVGRLVLLLAYAAIAVFGSLTTRIEDRVVPFERGVAYLLPSRPAHLLYTTGNSNQESLARETTKALGEFFFRRAGLATTATLASTTDGRELVRLAGRDSALMWIHSVEDAPVATAIARTRPCYDSIFQLACPALSDVERMRALKDKAAAN